MRGGHGDLGQHEYFTFRLGNGGGFWAAYARYLRVGGPVAAIAAGVLAFLVEVRWRPAPSRAAFGATRRGPARVRAVQARVFSPQLRENTFFHLNQGKHAGMSSRLFPVIINASNF